VVEAVARPTGSVAGFLAGPAAGPVLEVQLGQQLGMLYENLPLSRYKLSTAP
jgi:hypothetical protein